jgi:phage-related protein
MVTLPYNAQALIWMGGSKEALSSFPKGAKRKLGLDLRQVQNGSTPHHAKRLQMFGKDVYELRADDTGDTYRVVYLIKLKSGIHIIDAFMKKSTSGSAIPKADRRRIERRLARLSAQF